MGKASTESRRRLKRQREEAGLCVYCGESPPLRLKKGCSGCLRKKVEVTVAFSRKNLDTHAKRRRILRKEVIDKYGGSCVCCGEKETLFLTIDHRNGDGSLERAGLLTATGSRPSSTSFYLLLRRSEKREDLQVLCFNCNLGRSHNNGVCPHHHPFVLPSLPQDLRKIQRFGLTGKVSWPSDEELLQRVLASSCAKVGKELSVDHSAVRYRLARRGLYAQVQASRSKV